MTKKQEEQKPFSYSNISFDEKNGSITLGGITIDKTNAKEHLKTHDYKGLRVLYAIYKTLKLTNSKIDFRRGWETGPSIFLEKNRNEISRNYERFDKFFDFTNRKLKEKADLNRIISTELTRVRQLISKFNLHITMHVTDDNKRNQLTTRGYNIKSSDHSDIVFWNLIKDLGLT